ncbi:hypothetical protein [Thiothrix winogradskyi]|uniref:Transposase IS111A/IS1328/IS1533 N-terminal domain-containing protein n=1 Tax=Thiothrix winogradskyi TaxID=96472 RepID=A0ABY3T3E0_9GAMM|nr:hypothetical protein [Thiothrix winogradskyi]UJS25938.1 hypothetical protein L2Y54_07800 [Thiothrix winogradskyi]
MTDTVVSIGIDVAKDKLQIAWLRQLQPLQVKPKSLPNHPKGYEELLDWLLKNTGVTVERLRITLEPTNIYHEGWRCICMITAAKFVWLTLNR